jgi:hypothetical protein
MQQSCAGLCAYLYPLTRWVEGPSLELNLGILGDATRLEDTGDTDCGSTSGTSGNSLALKTRGQLRRSSMPVLLLWAVPAVIVVGGAGFFLLRTVH